MLILCVHVKHNRAFDGILRCIHEGMDMCWITTNVNRESGEKEVFIYSIGRNEGFSLAEREAVVKIIRPLAINEEVIAHQHMISYVPTNGKQPTERQKIEIKSIFYDSEVDDHPHYYSKISAQQP